MSESKLAIYLCERGTRESGGHSEAAVRPSKGSVLNVLLFLKKPHEVLELFLHHSDDQRRGCIFNVL